jgi:aldehyde dehydrogenase (NAD+)
MPTQTADRSPAIRDFDKVFIGGEWVEPAGDSLLEVVSPASGAVIARVPEPTVEDAQRALLAARKAFDEGPWRMFSPARRAKIVRRIGEECRARMDEMSLAYTAESGSPLAASRATHESRVPFYWSRAGDLTTYFSFEDQRGWPDGEGIARLVREPAGVGVGILPFNGPGTTAAQKGGAALVAGCTMVLKPAPEVPLSMYMLAEAVAAVEELPPGVLSILPAGREVGDHLVSSPLVDQVSFTGSTAAGRAVMRACSERIGRVALELGGKSAAILTEDVDLDTVLEPLMLGAIRAAGQICYATTRVVADRSIYDEVVERLAALMREVRVGDPMDPQTQVGPLVSERQRDRVQEFVDAGVEEGVRLVFGGKPPQSPERGWYFEPTLFAADDNDVSVARDEIFGPVLTAIPSDSDEDAVRIANDSIYGLGGSVFCRDVSRAEAIARRVRTGHVYVNTNGAFTGQPFGGFKQSGIGREGGPEGLEEWLETKVIFS